MSSYVTENERAWIPTIATSIARVGEVNKMCAEDGGSESPTLSVAPSS